MMESDWGMGQGWRNNNAQIQNRPEHARYIGFVDLASKSATFNIPYPPVPIWDYWYSDLDAMPRALISQMPQNRSDKNKKQ